VVIRLLFEKAKQYALDVVEGTEITTKEVKIQCQWFLNDIKNYNSAEFEFFLDLEFLDTLEGILNLLYFATGIGTQNKTILAGLANFQAFFLCNVFAWRFKAQPERYRYRDITMFIPRKNAKTFLTSICIIILLLTEEHYSEMYSICLDRELAGEVKKAITQILHASPAINKYFTIPKTLNGKILCKITNSFYQARTANASSNNAIRPAVYIADEVGAFKDYANLNAMKSGQLSVKNPLRFKLTTAYAEDKSIMLEELAYIKKVFSGVIEDKRMFALLYYADEEHLWDEFGLEQSNPLRIPENYNEIRDNRKVALEKPAEREEYLCKHMNYFLPSNSGESYINIEDLRKCKIDDFNWAGRKVWVGVDLAMTTDNCAVSMVTEEDLVIYCDSFAFIPAERIEEKNRFEKIHYQDFIKAGKCYPCGDMTVDYAFIEDMVTMLEEKFDVIVMGIGFDRYNCLSSAQKWENLGFKVVEVKQHASVLHPATKMIREKILNREFHYTENKLLEINFANCHVVENNNKDIYINKKKSSGKVDMVCALLNATHLLMDDVIFNPDQDWSVQVM
jgi:phage terminase large subunit-like protein